MIRSLACVTSAVVLFYSMNGAASGGFPAGEYMREGASGILTIGAPKGAGQPFEIESSGANGHSCTLDGTIVDGMAKLAEGSETEFCSVQFRAVAGGIEVKPNGGEACRGYCGARAFFDGTYLTVIPECRKGRMAAERAQFKKLYDAKAYGKALTVLQPLLDKCVPFLDEFDLGWIRNDLAITHHKMKSDAACLDALKPLSDFAEASDEELMGTEPAYADVRIALAKATRHNQKLCGAKAPKAK